METLTYPQALALAEKAVARKGVNYKNKTQSMGAARPCIVGMMMRFQRGNLAIIMEHNIECTAAINAYLYTLDERTIFFLSELMNFNDCYIRWGEVLETAIRATNNVYGPYTVPDPKYYVLVA